LRRSTNKICNLNEIESKKKVREAAIDFEKHFTSDNKNYELIFEAYKKLHDIIINS